MPKRIVARYGCGCRVSCSYGSYSIAYCPKHKAAPDMYEALMKFPHHVTTGDYTAEEIQQLIRKWRNSHCCEALHKANPRRKHARMYRCFDCRSILSKGELIIREEGEWLCPYCRSMKLEEARSCVAILKARP